MAGGLHRALARGAALRCGAVQIFTRNQRQWRAAPLRAVEVRAFARWRRATGIRLVFAHASYLINLAAPAVPAWSQAVDALTAELERAETLGLRFVVVHPGSHLGTGAAAGIVQVRAALAEALQRTAGARVRIALENTAGGGRLLGRRLAELAAMLEDAGDPDRLGVCIDTCHLFAGGYDIRSSTGYASAMAELATTVGVRRVLAFHLNDSGAPLGSGRDRHQHIGRGFLGFRPFRFLLADPRFGRVPKVLETPKEPEPLADRRNLAVLRRLRAGSRRRA